MYTWLDLTTWDNLQWMDNSNITISRRCTLDLTSPHGTTCNEWTTSTSQYLGHSPHHGTALRTTSNINVHGLDLTTWDNLQWMDNSNITISRVYTWLDLTTWDNLQWMDNSNITISRRCTLDLTSPHGTTCNEWTTPTSQYLGGVHLTWPHHMGQLAMNGQLQHHNI